MVVRVLAVTFVLYGAAVQAIGVYCADDSWNREPVSTGTESGASVGLV